MNKFCFPFSPRILVFVVMSLSFGATAQISLNSIEDIQQIGLSAAFPLDGNYVLTQDIDATGTVAWVSGAGFAPIADGGTPFTGIFDGQDHVIRGLVINRPVVDQVGLFSVIGAGGAIRRLGLEDVSITGKNKVSALAGVNFGDISYCHATGTVTTLNLYGGGLVAVNDGTGAILSCYADVTITGNYYLGGVVGDNTGAVITCFAKGNITGTGTSGGIIGYHNGFLQDSYARTAVTAEDTVGALTGENGAAAVISRCYGTGAVQGNDLVGGLTGYNASGNSVTASYWDEESTGQDTSGCGEGRSSSQMTYPYASTVYEGWNFSWVWMMDTDGSANDGYPYLQDNTPPTLHVQDESACGCNGDKRIFKNILGDYLLIGASLLALVSLRKTSFHG